MFIKDINGELINTNIIRDREVGMFFYILVFSWVNTLFGIGS